MNFFDEKKAEERDRRYWWFRLKEDFFRTETIIAMKTQGHNGPVMVLILLELYCLSLKGDGVISISNDIYGRNGLDEISRIIMEKTEDVKACIKEAVARGLLEIVSVDDSKSEIRAVGLVGMIGKSSKRADSQREIRHEEKRSLAAPKKDTSGYGEFRNVFVTKEEYAAFIKRWEKGKTVIEKLSAYKKSKGVNYEDDYATLQRWALSGDGGRENKPGGDKELKSIERELREEEIFLAEAEQQGNEKEIEFQRQKIESIKLKRKEYLAGRNLL